MTVSFLFGWQHILTGLVLLIAVAVSSCSSWARGRGAARSEWQADLDGAVAPARSDLGATTRRRPVEHRS